MSKFKNTSDNRLTISKVPTNIPAILADIFVGFTAGPSEVKEAILEILSRHHIRGNRINYSAAFVDELVEHTLSAINQTLPPVSEETVEMVTLATMVEMEGHGFCPSTIARALKIVLLRTSLGDNPIVLSEDTELRVITSAGQRLIQNRSNTK